MSRVALPDENKENKENKAQTAKSPKVEFKSHNAGALSQLFSKILKDKGMLTPQCKNEVLGDRVARAPSK